MQTRTLSLLIGMIGMTLCGCAPTPPVHLYTGLDASGSSRPTLGSCVILLKSCAETLKPSQDSLTLFRVDSETQEFSDGRYDGNIEETLQTIVTEIKQDSGRKGTYPARFWNRIAQRVAADPTPAVVILTGDGDNDDMTPQAWQEMRQAAEQLARCSQVRAVILCGVDKANVERLRDVFAPLKERFHPVMAGEIRDEKVLPLLQQARK